MNKTMSTLLPILWNACGHEEPRPLPCVSVAQFEEKSCQNSFETLTYTVNSCLSVRNISGPGSLKISVLSAPEGLYSLSKIAKEKNFAVFNLHLPLDETHYSFQIRRPTSTSPTPLRLDAEFALLD